KAAQVREAAKQRLQVRRELLVGPLLLRPYDQHCLADETGVSSSPPRCPGGPAAFGRDVIPSDSWVDRGPGKDVGSARIPHEVSAYLGKRLLPAHERDVLPLDAEPRS